MAETHYEALIKKGYSRREFLKMCTIMAAILGLEASGASKIAYALETKPRLPVIFLSLQECTCCTESFIRSAHPLFADIIMDMISLDYMEVLMACAGSQAEEAKMQSIKANKGNYLLVVEGSIPTKDEGIYCTIGGRTAQDVLIEAAKDAVAVIAFGSCACNGCVQSAYPNPTGAKPVKDIITDKPVINVPGCPPIPEVISGTVVHYLTFGRIPELTPQGRPKAFYNHRIHDNCPRRPFFDAGLFVESFDDAGHKQGWCLYKMGCKGPTTYNSCSITQWNNGVSFPIKSGHPCIGCSEPGYFDDMPMYERLAKIPGTARPIDPDIAGETIAAVTTAGVALHAAATVAANKAEKKKGGAKNGQPHSY